MGTSLVKPLTLSYRVGRVPKGFRPRSAHISADGGWDLQPARISRRGRLVVRATQFSISLPTWLNPAQWVSNLRQWGKNAANWVASGVGGRTQPPPGCGAKAPAWFVFDKRTDLVHVCSIDNQGRAEIQIKSNRGLSQVVSVPGTPEYVWVEDFPDAIRRRMPWTSAGDVVLAPGQTMTVGYARPATDTQMTFRSSIHAGWAQIDNVLRASADVLSIPSSMWQIVVAYAYSKCVTDLDPSIGQKPIDSELSALKAFCVLDVVEELAQDPEQALKFASELGLGDDDRDKLLRSARGISVIAKRTAGIGLVKDYAVRSVDDALRALLNDGNDQIVVSMEAAKKDPPTCDPNVEDCKGAEPPPDCENNPNDPRCPGGRAQRAARA